MYYEEGLIEACKKVNICVKCRLRFAEPHSFYCSECLHYIKKKNKKAYDKRKQDPDFLQKERERKRQDYYWRKEHGFCVKCGKPVKNHNTLCDKCRYKNHLRYESKKLY